MLLEVNEKTWFLLFWAKQKESRDEPTNNNNKVKKDQLWPVEVIFGIFAFFSAIMLNG